MLRPVASQALVHYTLSLTVASTQSVGLDQSVFHLDDIARVSLRALPMGLQTAAELDTDCAVPGSFAGDSRIQWRSYSNFANGIPSTSMPLLSSAHLQQHLVCWLLDWTPRPACAMVLPTPTDIQLCPRLVGPSLGAQRHPRAVSQLAAWCAEISRFCCPTADPKSLWTLHWTPV